MPFGPSRLWCSSRYAAAAAAAADPRKGGERGEDEGREEGEEGGGKEEATFSPLPPGLDATRGPSNCAEGIWAQCMTLAAAKEADKEGGNDAEGAAAGVKRRRLGKSENRVPSPPHFPRAFSAFHAGPGQLPFGPNPRRRMDLTLVPFPGRIEAHNFHERGVHYAGHLAGCVHRARLGREEGGEEERREEEEEEEEWEKEKPPLPLPPHPGERGLTSSPSRGGGGEGEYGSEEEEEEEEDFLPFPPDHPQPERARGEFLEKEESGRGDEVARDYAAELNLCLAEMRREAEEKERGNEEEKEEEEEGKGESRRGRLMVVPPNLHFSYQAHYACEYGLCTRAGLRLRSQRLAANHPGQSIAEEHPPPGEKGIGEVELLRRILLDPSYQGLVLIRKGREKRRDYLSQAMGFCLSHHVPNPYELGSQALKAALWECEGNPAEAVAWLERHCSQRHLTTAKKSFDGYSLHSTFMLRWLVQNRLLSDFELVHYVSLERRFFMFPFIFDLLQRRHALKREGGNPLLISTLKLLCNSSYGYYSIQSNNFPRTSVIGERWLHTVLEREPQRARNVISFTLLGATLRGSTRKLNKRPIPKRRARHAFVAWRQEGGEELSSSSPDTSSESEDSDASAGWGWGRRRRRGRRPPSLLELKRRRKKEREERESPRGGGEGKEVGGKPSPRGGRGRPRKLKTADKVELLYAVTERRPHSRIVNNMQTAVAILSESKVIMFSHLTFLLSCLGVRGGEYAYSGKEKFREFSFFNLKSKRVFYFFRTPTR